MVGTLKTLIERHKNDEIRALYGSGPYHLSQSYKRFQVDSVQWHSMNAKKKMKDVAPSRQYVPSFDEHFPKPKYKWQKIEWKRVRKKKLEILIDRNNSDSDRALVMRVENPNASWRVEYQLFLRSLVPCLVERCQGNCIIKLKPADNRDYLLVKSHGTSTYTVQGESRTRYGRQYIHFKADCLKEDAHAKQDTVYDVFPFELIKVQKETLKQLTEEEKEYLQSFNIKLND